MSPLFGLLCPDPAHRADEPALMQQASQRPQGAALAWPLPAVLAWVCAWVVWRLAAGTGMVAWVSFGMAVVVGTLVALTGATRWRRAIAACGFPIAALVLGAGALPPWAWLVLLMPLLAVYPLRAWSDAPFFPTPSNALVAIDGVITASPARVLDAGCGLGHGLQALRGAWPDAELHGVEWSALLSAIAPLRCRRIDASVRRADMWATSWSGYDLVYLFQRPESMARAFAKARAELAPGAWFVSLEFAVPDSDRDSDRDTQAEACLQRCLQAQGRRALWVYRMPGPVAARSTEPRSRR